MQRTFWALKSSIRPYIIAIPWLYCALGSMSRHQPSLLQQYKHTPALGTLYFLPHFKKCFPHPSPPLKYPHLSHLPYIFGQMSSYVWGLHHYILKCTFTNMHRHTYTSTPYPVLSLFIVVISTWCSTYWNFCLFSSYTRMYCIWGKTFSLFCLLLYLQYLEP